MWGDPPTVNAVDTDAGSHRDTEVIQDVIHSTSHFTELGSNVSAL